jgi:hypothetical protein
MDPRSRKTRALTRWPAWILASLAVGCGGNVVVDGTASAGGAGGAGGSIGCGSVVRAHCATYCEVFAPVGCDPAACLDQCLTTYTVAAAWGCTDAYLALVDCTAHSTVIACDMLFSQSCYDSPVGAPYHACEEQLGPCAVYTCTLADCSCATSCGTTKYASQCQETDGGVTCACLRGGTSVGNCSTDATCNTALGSCCYDVFFPPC